MGPPIHLIPWRKTMMKNVPNQNFKPEIATQISVQLVPQPVSLNFFYLYENSCPYLRDKNLLYCGSTKLHKVFSPIIYGKSRKGQSKVVIL